MLNRVTYALQIFDVKTIVFPALSSIIVECVLSKYIIYTVLYVCVSLFFYKLFCNGDTSVVYYNTGDYFFVIHIIMKGPVNEIICQMLCARRNI